MELKKYPFRIIGTDINNNAPGIKFCDKFYQLGYGDYEGLLNLGNLEGVLQDYSSLQQIQLLKDF